MRHSNWITATACLIATGTLAFASPADPPADSRIDAIKPEDIATFPDVNLAEAIRHPKGLIIESAADQIPKLYEDAGSELGLSAETHLELIDLLIDREVQWRWPECPVDADDRKCARLRRAEDRRYERELRALLGRKGVAALERYEDSMEPRYEVEEMRWTLASSKLPISEVQRRTMVLSVLRSGVLEPRRRYSRNEGADAVRQHVQARVELNDRRLLEVARGILTPEQMDAYSKHLNERRASVLEAETPPFALEKTAGT